MNEDAKRCLKCKNPFCSKGCPVTTEIPKIIDLYLNNEIKKAQELLFENNPMSAICSIVCDWNRQCFGHCVLNHKNVPIHFYEIEQELSIDYLKNTHFEKNTVSREKVAIVGGGPAGITSALKLSDAGYDVTIYEANSQLGGVLMYGIPSFRLDKELVAHYERILCEKGVKIRKNVKIGETLSLEDLKKDGAKSIILCCGAGKAKKLNIPNETSFNVHYAIDYLKDPEKIDLGKKVIVLGGGNVAMDACRTAKRLGYDVTVHYRKTYEDMPANKNEVNDAIEEGVKFEMFEVPEAFDETGMIFSKGRNEINERGRLVTVTIPDTKHHVDCDSVIIAVSQTITEEMFYTTNLKKNRWGYVDTDDIGRSIDDPCVYTCGDYHLGASTVVQAVKDAKVIVETIRGEYE